MQYIIIYYRYDIFYRISKHKCFFPEGRKCKFFIIISCYCTRVRAVHKTNKVPNLLISCVLHYLHTRCIYFPPTTLRVIFYLINTQFMNILTSWDYITQVSTNKTSLSNNMMFWNIKYYVKK